MAEGNIKILVVSDSHGNMANVRKAVEKEVPFDILVHCGDLEGSPDTLRSMGEFQVMAVRGNCDYNADLKPDETFKAGFYTIWVTHGDRYRVKYEEKLTSLDAAAKERRADIVLFGHSHFAEIVRDEDNNILMLNPGTVMGSRINAEAATYATLLLTDDYEIIPEIKSL